MSPENLPCLYTSAKSRDQFGNGGAGGEAPCRGRGGTLSGDSVKGPPNLSLFAILGYVK